MAVERCSKYGGYQSKGVASFTAGRWSTYDGRPRSNGRVSALCTWLVYCRFSWLVQGRFQL